MITLTIIATWKLLVKAGEKGWKCLIPFYGDYIMYKKFYDKRLFWNLLIAWLLTAVLIIASLCIAIPKLISYYSYGYGYSWAYHYSNSVNYIGPVGVIAIIFGAVTLVCSIVFSLLLMWYTGRAFNASTIHCLGMIFLPIPSIIALGLDDRFTYQGNQRPFCIPKREKKQKTEEPQEPESTPVDDVPQC